MGISGGDPPLCGMMGSSRRSSRRRKRIINKIHRIIHQLDLPIIIIILNAVDSDFIVFVYTIVKRFFLWAE